jgi:hypothetical protein
MAAYPPSRVLDAGRVPRPGAPSVWREPARSQSGWLTPGFLIRVLIVGFLALTGWQVWSHFAAEPATPARPPVSAEAVAGIQITLGQAALALRDYGKGGLLSDRFDFEQNMARVRRSVETLEGIASEADERQALSQTKSLLERLVRIEKEHIARIDAGAGVMGVQKLTEIASLRDEAAKALTEFRQTSLRHVVPPEADSIGRLLRGSIGAGAGLLSLCIGAITLWSRLFPV